MATNAARFSTGGGGAPDAQVRVDFIEQWTGRDGGRAKRHAFNDSYYFHHHSFHANYDVSIDVVPLARRSRALESLRRRLPVETSELDSRPHPPTPRPPASPTTRAPRASSAPPANSSFATASSSSSHAPSTRPGRPRVQNPQSRLHGAVDAPRRRRARRMATSASSTSPCATPSAVAASPRARRTVRFRFGTWSGGAFVPARRGRVDGPRARQIAFAPRCGSLLLAAACDDGSCGFMNRERDARGRRGTSDAFESARPGGARRRSRGDARTGGQWPLLAVGMSWPRDGRHTVCVLARDARARRWRVVAETEHDPDDDEGSERLAWSATTTARGAINLVAARGSTCRVRCTGLTTAEWGR